MCKVVAYLYYYSSICGVQKHNNVSCLIVDDAAKIQTGLLLEANAIYSCYVNNTCPCKKYY